MFFNWKGASIVLAALAVVVSLCAIDLRCSGDPGPGSDLARIKGDLDAGKKAMKLQEAENLASVARDLRALALRYKAQGEIKKAHRAIGAAQDLDRKIRKLVEEAK